MKKQEKRTDVISWDAYFMGVAGLSAMRSKDPSTQVGACIVDSRNRILSVGYNGFPAGCDDDSFPWGKGDEDPCNNKYFYVMHSELNAILNFRGESLAGSRLYVTMFPCNECAKAIIQTGIKEVIFFDDAYQMKPEGRATMRMFDAAGVKYRKYEDTNRCVKIHV